MSAISMMGRSLLGIHSNRDRHNDPLARLRFAIETMPGSRKYQFTPSTRLEVLNELYSAFWGPYSDLFLPQSSGPLSGLLSEAQKAAYGYGTGDDTPIPGKPCGRIFKKGDSCYRCRSQAIVDQWAIRHRATVPHELRDYMGRTVAYALDFVLDTLDFSPPELSLPPTEAELKKVSTADPLGNDLFAIIVWNDEKHSFDECISHIRDSVGCTWEEAAEFTNKIDGEGRAVVEVSSNIPKLLGAAKQIASIEMGVTLRRAYDVFREQVSAVIIEWLMDLTQCRILNDCITLREVIAAETYAPRKKDSSSLTSNQEATKVLAEIKDAARLDWLFLYHAKLWKRVRLNLKRIMASILTINHEHRLTVAVHFASVYHRIIDTYLLVDREAETSIKYFSIQLFTVPSVAAYIVRHNGIITRLLSIIINFFTNNIQNKRIIPAPDSGRRIDVESYPFKSKRFMPVFSDLRYICTNRTIQELIAHNHDYVVQFIPVCQLFMGINSNKRAATSHVEYETESWISVFNVTLSLSRVVKVYGEAFQYASTNNLVYAIIAVLHAILSTCTLSNDQLDKNKYSLIMFHSVPFGDAEYSTIQFDVLSQWVSFHHSLHWLLAELFKHVHLLTGEKLRDIGFKSLREVILRNASERAMLTVVDFPLRVVTMVAQIRTGLWVRNGFAIRGQLLHYRDFMLRELCYDQDLYILQSALVILDPNIVLVSILDRFQLVEWFSGEVAHASYDGGQLFSMVEEFLYVIITCVSESANAHRLTPLQVVRREIVHGLALGPCSFTELCKRVAERIVDDANLDKALSMVAKYRAPAGTSDFGVYELQDELFDEVNPFFFHYTRNRREEAEGILKARLTKATGNAAPVVVPKPMDVTDGPFVDLPLIFHSEVLMQIIFFAIRNVFVHTEAAGSIAASGDAILDQVLHLTMLGLVEQPARFIPLCLGLVFEREDMALVDILCKLEYNDVYKAFKPKVQWCLDKMAEMHPTEVAQRRTSPATQDPSVDAADQKKRAAKARQAMIMQQFAAAQKSFLDQYEDEDDDDDEDGEGTATPPEKAEPLGPCIVCQEELDATQPFGILGFIQPSRVIKRLPQEPRWEVLKRDLECPQSLDRPILPPSPPDVPQLPPQEEVAPFGVTPSEETRFGLDGSVCGHLMHVECFSVYNASIEQRHLAQPTRNHPEVVERKEFLCPLCKSLGNIVIPVTPKPHPSAASESMSLSEWMRKSKIEFLTAEQEPVVDALQLQYSGEFVFWAAEDTHFPAAAARTETEDGLYHMTETVDNIIRPLSAQTGHLREREEPPVGSRGRGLYLPNDFVGYTVSCAEIAQRGIGEEGKTVADTVNDSTVMRLIRGLVTCLATRAELELPGRRNGGHRVLEQAILRRILPGGIRDHDLAATRPFLFRDPLGVLLEVAAVNPEILGHITGLMYYASLVRTTIALVEFLAQTAIDEQLDTIYPTHQDLFGDTISTFVLSVCRHSKELEQSAENILRAFGEGMFERMLYAHTLPFLRAALLVNRAILPPRNGSAPDPSLPEYHRLLHLLNIPPLSDISSPSHEGLRVALASWCSHFGQNYGGPGMIILDYPDVHRLARIPRILDEIFTQNAEALTCQRCETIPVDPAICLICGTVCCHQSHCCVDEDDRKQGECNMHTRECGGAVGVFFLVKRCMVLYLYAGSGSFTQPPYLDVHGEFDYMMRRGRRQYLHMPRFEDVRKTWLNHGIPTFTARKLDASIDSGGWDSV
ncbi:hypothetical protein M407DRAFT_231664 [Tulasnella calospora MUT 4182]|uniref:E3 ubiquitin-protein ligase n=1 Tax=Tulasnella calospora MUT 4182 TaxID=1051891 RepID=A0A0C3MIP7_9AGAM|nr:hypothetical protein M407DRAFT_231664 [Tulasnella calospora MUT 4182]